MHMLAGGAGARTGLDVPKQSVMIEGKPLLFYSSETIDRCGTVDAMIIVALTGWRGFVEGWIQKLRLSKAK